MEINNDLCYISYSVINLSIYGNSCVVTEYDYYMHNPQQQPPINMTEEKKYELRAYPKNR